MVQLKTLCCDKGVSCHQEDLLEINFVFNIYMVLFNALLEILSIHFLLLIIWIQEFYLLLSTDDFLQEDTLHSAAGKDGATPEGEEVWEQVSELLELCG